MKVKSEKLKVKSYNSKFKIKRIKNLGFTLLELLVVMAILGILATVGFGQYKTSQVKARDAQRKADLGNISRALEMYYNDNGVYPLSSDTGKMDVNEDGLGLDWGTAFETGEIIYMKVLPKDPSFPTYEYCYNSTDGSSYQLYAVLENENDNDRDDNQTLPLDYSCLSDSDYNYGMSSPNTAP